MEDEEPSTPGVKGSPLSKSNITTANAAAATAPVVATTKTAFKAVRGYATSAGLKNETPHGFAWEFWEEAGDPDYRDFNSCMYIKLIILLLINCLITLTTRVRG